MGLVRTDLSNASARADVCCASAAIRRAVVVMLLPMLSCRDVAGPRADGVPPNARRYQPPPVYAVWWRQVLECSGRAAPSRPLEWYSVPGSVIEGLSFAPNGRALGYYAGDGRIVLAETRVGESGTVRHEMLHAVLNEQDYVRGGGGDHPPDFFQGRCGGWVACWGSCEAEGSPESSVPADAPVVPASALALRVRVAESTVSRSGAVPWVQIVVEATNASDRPVWAALDGPPNVVPTEPTYGWLGFDLGPSTNGFSWVGREPLVIRGRVPFAPGETRVQVYDVDVSDYPVGPLVAWGRLAGRESAPVGVTIVP